MSQRIDLRTSSPCLLDIHLIRFLSSCIFAWQKRLQTGKLAEIVLGDWNRIFPKRPRFKSSKILARSICLLPHTGSSLPLESLVPTKNCNGVAEAVWNVIGLSSAVFEATKRLFFNPLTPSDNFWESGLICQNVVTAVSFCCSISCPCFHFRKHPVTQKLHL